MFYGMDAEIGPLAFGWPPHGRQGDSVEAVVATGMATSRLLLGAKAPWKMTGGTTSY